jgi:hypothetical protein
MLDHLSTMQYLGAGALGLGLAACSGFRVFVPLLAASVAHRLGWLPSSPGFDWLSTWPALLMLATATVAELVGYYVPLFDHLLDTLTTPASFIAGTLLMTSSLTHLDPALDAGHPGGRGRGGHCAGQHGAAAGGLHCHHGRRG